MSLRALSLALAVFAALLGSPVASAQETTRRVAVVVSSQVNLEDHAAVAAAQALATALERGLEVQARADGMTQELAEKESGDLQRCSLEVECMSRLRKALWVDAVLLVALARVGDVMRIDIRHASASSHQPVQVFQRTLRRGVQVDDFERSVGELVPGARPRRRKQPDAASGPRLRAPVASPPASNGFAADRITTPVLVSGALTMASVAGAVTFSVLAISHTECDVDPGCARSEAERADRQALIADILWAASGVGAVVSAVLFATAGDDQASVQAGVAPVRGGAGLVLGGTF